ncbi:MAG: NADP-dependent isocitrate dehydrogenase, partial [Promicromonosporaceae bacterium]|nr:NADP-dependent isocitrate dehydrogenase [Promicromonosporaceae bacterium]
MDAAGRVDVVSAAGEVLLTHEVSAGDIWRGSLSRSEAITNWVALAVERGRLTGDPVVFWLDPGRPHDAVMLFLVEAALSALDTEGADIHLMPPTEACQYSLDRMRAGLDTIGATGNVLRDYLTDLFPILELGTSAKMLSVVPLLAGGGLFETGAGGSAPKQVTQLVEENHLRWDSLGEFLALAAAFEHFARVESHANAAVLADTLDQATAKYLSENKAPRRRAGELDNRGSHYYLARYWAEALAAQSEAPELAAAFAPLAVRLHDDEPVILAELTAGADQPVDLGGYYHFDPELAEAVMRPSSSFNQIIQGL